MVSIRDAKDLLWALHLDSGWLAPSDPTAHKTAKQSLTLNCVLASEVLVAGAAVSLASKSLNIS